MSRGIYSLIIYLDKARKIEVGSLGSIEFPIGYYVYTGSALNNLEARIARHERKGKKLRWHIDYLLQKARIEEVLTLRTGKKVECEASSKILNSASWYVKNFGCSDCRCKTHLNYFKSFKEAKSAVANSYSSFQ